MKKLFVILTFTFGVTAGCAIDLPTVTQAADADGGGNCSGCRASRNSPPSGASSRFCHFTDWPTQRVGATWRSPLAVLVAWNLFGRTSTFVRKPSVFLALVLGVAAPF